MKREYRTIIAGLLLAQNELSENPKLEPLQQRTIRRLLREMQESTKAWTETCLEIGTKE